LFCCGFIDDSLFHHYCDMTERHSYTLEFVVPALKSSYQKTEEVSLRVSFETKSCTIF
jgi:hypothetical protein